MSKHTLNDQIKKERTYLYAALGMLFFLVILYMYFLSVSVVHVVIRKEANHDIRELQSQVALLESEYIKAQHSVSSDIASLQGFVATPEKIFLDRTPDSLVLRSDN